MAIEVRQIVYGKCPKCNVGLEHVAVDVEVCPECENIVFKKYMLDGNLSMVLVPATIYTSKKQYKISGQGGT